MSILLESDSNTSVQSHFDELTFRTTILFLSVSLLSLGWLMIIDDVLLFLLDHLQPCKSECLNVFDPAQWSVVRWLSAIILGIMSALPLMVFHILQFSKPGLLPKEFKALKRWTLSGAFGIVLSSAVLIWWVYPKLYEWGYEHHTSVNLIAQYDAAELLLYVFLSVWVMMIFSFTWMSLAFLGKGRILNTQTAEFWRWRIYGFGTLLLLLSMPEQSSGLGLSLLILYWTSSEFVGSSWLKQDPNEFGNAATRLDHEGRKRRLMIADCSCLGANAHYGSEIIEGYSMMRFSGICTKKNDRNRLMEHVLSNRITDVIITGCDSRPCPDRLRENFSRLGTNLKGLDLMRLQNIRPGLPQRPQLDLECALVTLEDPFPLHSTPQRLSDFMNEHSVLPSEIMLTNLNPNGWSNYANNNSLVVAIEGESELWNPMMAILSQE